MARPNNVKTTYRIVGIRDGHEWHPPKREKSGVIAPRTYRQQIAWEGKVAVKTKGSYYGKTK